MQKITKKIHIFYILMVVAIGVALMSLSSTVSLYAQTNGTSSTTTKNIMSNVKATADESINKTTMTRQSIDESSKIRVIVIFEVKEGNKQKALDTLASLADLAKKGKELFPLIYIRLQEIQMNF